MSPCPTFIYPNFSFPCKSAQQLFFLSESLSHFLFPSLSHPNVVSKQPRKLYHNYTPDIDLSMYFGSCPTPHAPSSSLCFIHFPNSSFLLFISFLFSFQRQREASKSGFVAIVTRGLAAFEEENSGARCGDVLIAMTTLYFFSISVEVCSVMSLFHLCLHQGIIQTDFICPQKPANHRCFGLCCITSGVSFTGENIEISHF